MEDLFEREQAILDNAENRIREIECGAPYGSSEYIFIVKEYSRLLRQLRRITKLSDRTTIELNESKLDLLNQIHYDALTGIYNRRFMENTLKRVIASLSRSSGMLSVLMIDIDHFKSYNDTYGHNEGDICLKAVAEVLRDSIMRSGDFVARYGGEEFIIVLPMTDESGARSIASRILVNIRACAIPHEKNEAASCVTISVGATTGSVTSNQDITDFIKRADEALYISKQSGRNKYTFLDFKEES